jgi:hypothetical protein
MKLAELLFCGMPRCAGLYAIFAATGCAKPNTPTPAEPRRQSVVLRRCSGTVFQYGRNDHQGTTTGGSRLGESSRGVKGGRSPPAPVVIGLGETRACLARAPSPFACRVISRRVSMANRQRARSEFYSFLSRWALCPSPYIRRFHAGDELHKVR